MAYVLLKYVHVIGATIILGTGAGIAFFMMTAHVRRDAAFIARTAGAVVLADLIFTMTAVIAQPLTGYLLLRETGIAFSTGWVIASLGLYAVAGLFWIPVLWMQEKMGELAAAAASKKEPLPPAYHRLFRLWFAFGVPGFGAVLGILWLMIAKPSL